MAEQCPHQHSGCESNIDSTNRGLFDCFGKKEEKPKEDAVMADAEHKSSLMEKLHRSNSSSSSSSEEEVEEGGVKIRRRKKKGLTEKIKEKLPGHGDDRAAVAVEGEHNHHQYHQGATVNAEVKHSEENKGFLEKIKEKMPGHHKDAPAPTPAPGPVDGQYMGMEASHEPNVEKKGIFEKIKEKLPGGNKDGAEAKEHH